MLVERYPELKIVPNCKEMLEGLEVDVSIPELNLAIEWNGVVHFKPIYGDEQFTRIQHVDVKKQLVAQEKGIRLVVISDLVSTKQFVVEAFMSTCKLIDELKQTNIPL